MRNTNIRILLCSVLFIGLFISGCAYNNPDVYLQVASKTICEVGGEEITIVVRVKNTGEEVLSSEKKHFLSYHLLDMDGNKLVFDNVRTEIPVLKTGEIADISMKVDVPTEKGTYIIEADIVQEGVTWFKDKGNETAKGKLIVKKSQL